MSRDGFKLVQEKLSNPENQTAKIMSMLLLPLANAAPLLAAPVVKKFIFPGMDAAFKFSKVFWSDFCLSFLEISFRKFLSNI